MSRNWLIVGLVGVGLFNVGLAFTFPWNGLAAVGCFAAAAGLYIDKFGC